MADLTDVTITPMISVGIGVTTVLLAKFNGWSFPVALVVAVVPGALLGFGAGVLLTIVVSTSLDLIRKLKARKGAGHRQTPN